MQIEYLFPKDLENNAAMFKEIKEQYDLPLDFDLVSIIKIIFIKIKIHNL